nr:MAG: hypothetical protein [Porcellio scaber clopovirus]
MASVDLIIYNVDLSDIVGQRHSILGFNSPITYIDSETGGRRKFSFDGDGTNLIHLNRKAYLYPILEKHSSKHQFDDFRYIISRLDQYLYFDCSPEELQNTLEMELKTPDNIFLKINLNITIRMNIDCYIFLTKMFKQWYIQMTLISEYVRENKELKWKILDQCLKVIFKLLERSITYHCQKLYATPNRTSVEIEKRM